MSFGTKNVIRVTMSDKPDICNGKTSTLLHKDLLDDPIVRRTFKYYFESVYSKVNMTPMLNNISYYGTEGHTTP